ncbi:MAG: hypothetical protein JWQ08_548 [Deinococcus sp.]|nr:hypothetical protein [Deinococcus sp.]
MVESLKIAVAGAWGVKADLEPLPFWLMGTQGQNV